MANTLCVHIIYTDMPELADQQELIYISSVQTQDIVWKTCQEQWMIGMDEERERERESQGDPCCPHMMMMMIVYKYTGCIKN